LLETIQTFVTPKEARKKTGLLDVVKAPGNSRTITIPMNKPRVFSAYKHTENVNVKLTPRVSSSIGGQLATNKASMLRITLETKVARFWLQRILWVAERVRCIREFEFNKEVHS